MTLYHQVVLWRAVRRERREFRKAYRNYCHHVIPMAEVQNRFAEFGHKLMESPWVLLPLGLMCLWAVLYSAGCFKP